MANLNLSQFTEKTLVADADWVFVWDTAGAISKKVSRNSLLSVGSIATSTPVTINQTWNDAAVAFAAMKIVATDTNSASGSDFLELYSGTSTQPLRLDIQKTGQVNIYGTWTNSTTYERLSLSAPTAANAIIGTNRSGGTARGLDFHTEGAARMTIGTTGNVGIGTTAPLANLQIGNQVTLQNIVGLQAMFGWNMYYDGSSWKYITNGRAAAIRMNGGASSSGDITFHTAALGLNGGIISDTDASGMKMIIQNTGNVGIGTTAPSSKLDVVGAVTVSTYIKVSPVAVTSLPDAATAGVGARAFVNDALAPVFGSTVATGGAVAVPVYSDGSAWKVG